MTSDRHPDEPDGVPGKETLSLLHFMGSPHGWGREHGRAVYGKLLAYVESRPGVRVFHVSLHGVRRIDISFASETIVELAWRYRGTKGFALTEITDTDLLENLEAAAVRKNQPLMVWNEGRASVIGPQPSRGNFEAFEFALRRPSVRAAQFASAATIPIGSASMKFKQLCEQGFLLRHEAVADSGGVEFVYFRIG